MFFLIPALSLFMPVHLDLSGKSAVEAASIIGKATGRPVVISPKLALDGEIMPLGLGKVEATQSTTLTEALRTAFHEIDPKNETLGLNNGDAPLPTMLINGMMGGLSYLVTQPYWVNLMRQYPLNVKSWARNGDTMKSTEGVMVLPISELTALPWSHKLVFNPAYASQAVILYVDSCKESDLLATIATALGGDISTDSQGDVQISPNPKEWKTLLQQGAAFYSTQGGRWADWFGFASGAYAAATEGNIKAMMDDGKPVILSLSKVQAQAPFYEKKQAAAMANYSKLSNQQGGGTMADQLDIDQPIALLAEFKLPSPGCLGKQPGLQVFF